MQETNALEKLVPTIREFADTNPEIPITADRTIDKLDILMLTMAVEEDFDITISDSDMDECKTVGDIVNLIEKESKC